MEIYDYYTSGGKNLIMEYVEKLETKERAEVLDAREQIRDYGLDAFEKLNTRQLDGKIWEVKLSKIRIMYVIVSEESVFFLNICRKQKGKTEKQELDKARRRAQTYELL